jgi:uncharacterized protein
MTDKLNIAVIGSGISGLSSAWLLSQNHDVTLFEKDSRLGGHSNTVDIDTASGKIAVDTGFIVFNDRCYPNLQALFSTLGVTIQNTEMSFGVSLDHGRLEYAGSDSLRTLFAQKRNLFKPRFWSMINDLLRFYRQSPAWMQSMDDDLTLGELLQREKLGAGFRDDHLLPMGAAIWSTPVDKMLGFPAKSFLRFCDNHGLLLLKDRPQWMTLKGGSREYVSRIADAIGQGNIRLSCGIERITRHPNHVELIDQHGAIHHFDHVVLASHADHSLGMLSDATRDEQQLLGSFGYELNRTILHSDERLMPTRRAVWSSWNYLASQQNNSQKVSVSYWMNALQHLPCTEPVIVTLNPIEEPRQNLVYREFTYHHPVFNRDALQAQEKLWQLQGQQRTWFCGSYFGYGFHEDGIQSGLAVAEQLGGRLRPWHFDKTLSRIPLPEPATDINDLAA